MTHDKRKKVNRSRCRDNSSAQQPHRPSLGSLGPSTGVAFPSRARALRCIRKLLPCILSEWASPNHSANYAQLFIKHTYHGKTSLFLSGYGGGIRWTRRRFVGPVTSSESSGFKSGYSTFLLSPTDSRPGSLEHLGGTGEVTSFLYLQGWKEAGLSTVLLPGQSYNIDYDFASHTNFIFSCSITYSSK